MMAQFIDSGQLLQDSRRKNKEKEKEIHSLRDLVKNFSDGTLTESLLESQYGVRYFITI